MWREREKQRTEFTLEHDDEHANGELAAVALSLVAFEMCAIGESRAPHAAAMLTPGGLDRWGLCARHHADRRKRLVIAAALLIAEIERLDRASLAKVASSIDSTLSGDVNGKGAVKS